MIGLLTKNRNVWKSWKNEYFNDLNNRTKWRKSNLNITVGDMVLVKELDSEPRKWSLATGYNGKEYMIVRLLG